MDISCDTDDHPNVLSDNSKPNGMKFHGEKEKAKIVNKIWIAHKRYNCSVCMLYHSQQKKGRPVKTKKSGRPKNADTKVAGNIFRKLFTEEVPSRICDLEIQNMS